MPAFWFVEIELPFPALAPFEELLGDLEDETAPGVAVSSYEVAPMPDPDLAQWRLQVLFDAPPDEAAWRKRLRSIASGMNLGAAPIFAGKLPDQDWVRHTNKLNAPVPAGRFFLYGAHDAGLAPPGSLSLLLDAGLAFGTGRAPSTFGCLLAIDHIARRKALGHVLDLGTGSGVLAMAAAKAGAAQVWAADIDPVAVQVARENAALNGLSAQIRCLVAAKPLHPGLPGPFDLVVANILAGPLCAMAHGLSRQVAPGGYLILSGLLAKEERKVAAYYRGQGLSFAARIPREGWHTLVFRKSAPALIGLR